MFYFRAGILVIVLLLLMGCQNSIDYSKKKGLQLFHEGETEKAYLYLEQGFTDDFSDPDYIAILAHCRAHVVGDASGAIQLLMDNTLQHPKHAQSFVELSKIAYEFSSKPNDENLVQALNFIRKAAELDTNNPEIFENMASYHLNMGHLDSALYWYDEVKKNDPDDMSIKLKIIRVLSLLEQRMILDSLSGIDTIIIAP